MPGKKILFALEEDGYVKGKIGDSAKLDPITKALLIFVVLVLVFVCCIVTVPQIRDSIYGVLSARPRITATPMPSLASARVVWPPDHSTVWLGQPVEVRIAVDLEVAITRVELRVNGTSADSAIPTPVGPVEVAVLGVRPLPAVTAMMHAFSWTPRSAGLATLEVVIHVAGGPPITTDPVVYNVVDNRGVLTAVAGQLGPSPTPTATFDPRNATPSPTSTLTATPGPPEIPVPRPTAFQTPAGPVTQTPGAGVATATVTFTPLPVVPTVTATYPVTPTPDVGAPDVSTGF